MAQRFGGKYSPGAPAGAGADDAGPVASPRMTLRVDPAGARSNVLFLPPVVLAFTSLNDGATGLVVGLAGAAALVLGAWLLRDGLRAQAAYDQRTLARRPAIPRKIFAAVACGVGTAIAAWTSEPGVIAPLLFGGAAAVLHLGAFGIDPLRDKGLDGETGFQSERVARVIDEAESVLGQMAEAGRATGDRQVEARIARFATQVRDMIRTVEADPRDLTAARRYLGVYLIGARDAAQKFAELHARGPDPDARAKFLLLLTDLEESYGKKTETLLIDNATDLTVEIDVLRERLGREGVRLDP